MQLPKCDLCGRDVQLKDGVLSISFREIRAVQSAEDEFRKAHSGPVLDARDIADFPDKVAWKWRHYWCDPGEFSYDIEWLRFNTIQLALHWTLHLMAKNWFQFTNWRSVIERFYPECV
jgi:hypothetical protein